MFANFEVNIGCQFLSGGVKQFIIFLSTLSASFLESSHNFTFFILLLTFLTRLARSSNILGADGTSAVNGCNEGVSAKLKREYPWLIYAHCPAHCLNLIVASYLSKVKTGKVVIEAYKAVLKIFNVAKTREIFEESQKLHYSNEPIHALSE